MWLVLYMNLKECSKIYGVLFLNCMFLLDVIGYSLKMDYEDMILELIFEILFLIRRYRRLRKFVN